MANRRHGCLWSKTVGSRETAPDTPCRQRLQSLAAAASVIFTTTITITSTFTTITSTTITISNTYMSCTLSIISGVVS